jgi:chromosome segregation protein
VAQRRSAPDEGADAERRVQLEAGLAAERRLLERAERERSERVRRAKHERERLRADEGLEPRAARLVAALEAAGAAIAGRVEGLGAELEAERAAGERVAGELRACAGEEHEVQSRLKTRGEEVTRAEVRAQSVRDAAAEAETQLGVLADRLGLEAGPAPEPLSDDERDAVAARIERLVRRREQLGPVNPLAQREYADAVAHVEELEAQRGDLEAALRELATLIRDTDRRIGEAFDETFAAAARNFEEVVEQLFPGGRGRLRLVHEEAGPRPVLGGEAGEELAAEAEEEPAEAEPGRRDRDHPRREVHQAALAALRGREVAHRARLPLRRLPRQAVPFYILDEVEAALDDLNIDRFLGILRRFSDRAQFIVVTHQKRTMEAADCLYGVSMAGNGVSKVLSRRLPPRAADAA